MYISEFFRRINKKFKFSISIPLKKLIKTNKQPKKHFKTSLFDIFHSKFFKNVKFLPVFLRKPDKYPKMNFLTLFSYVFHFITNICTF